jgi:predicted CXXCH cytochrome family protein
MLPVLALFAALAGYVNDSACAHCHTEIARSYQHVGMARSFFRPRQNTIIEELGKEFVHTPSKQIFQMVWRDGRLIFRRYQNDPGGHPINLFEQPVDWILGSGYRTRVYVYQTPDGELYQLPIAWYSQTRSWGMAPGYDRPDHDGVTRRVRHECMFCHNAYPDTAQSHDGYWRAQAFPKELPEGTGCQRCHGPGAEHAKQPKSAILNPIRLTKARRDDVCNQCHLLPAVAVQGARRLGRDIYSFRPGDALSEYQLTTDIASKDRFEISQHAYRLQQSRCYRESKQQLECITCHDPHVRLPPEERAARVQRVCLSCHQQAHYATSDCTPCHMQQRRTEDVVHVAMTDHRIGLPSDSAKLLAPRAEKEDPAIDDVELYGVTAPDLYRLLPLMRAGRDRDPRLFARFEQALAAAKPPELEPLFDLANGQANQKQWPALESTCKKILGREPENALALGWLGLAASARNRDDDAIAFFRRALRSDPNRAGLHVQLALALHRQGKDDDAIAELDRATALRPNLAAAWLALGDLHARRDNPARAVFAFRRALAIEPNDPRAYAALERALLALGDRDGAERVRRHAAFLRGSS